MSDMPVVTGRLIITETPKIKKPKRIWDNYREIGEVQKSDRIKFVIAAAVRDGVKYINIREFYLRQRDGVWRPGRDGITIPLFVPVEKGTRIIHPYNDFKEVLEQAVNVLETMELEDEEHAVWLNGGEA